MQGFLQFTVCISQFTYKMCSVSTFRPLRGRSPGRHYLESFLPALRGGVMIRQYSPQPTVTIYESDLSAQSVPPLANSWSHERPSGQTHRRAGKLANPESCLSAHSSAVRLSPLRAAGLVCVFDPSIRPYEPEASAFCLLPSAICHLPSAFCHLPSAICLLPSAICLLPSAICHLPSAFCHLPSAFCHLPSLLPAQTPSPHRRSTVSLASSACCSMLSTSLNWLRARSRF